MKKIPISLIVAIGNQNQIGLNGQIPWHISGDLKLFKKITESHTIIMGRKTYESIGRPLPNRQNIVVTSHPEKFAENYKDVFEKSVELASDLNSAIKLCRRDEIFIIGGSSLYNEALSKVTTLHLSKIPYDGEADTYFPTIDFLQWSLQKKIEYDEFSYECWTLL